MTPPRTVSLLLAVAPLAGCALEGYDPSEYLAYPALEDLAPLPGAPTLWDLTGANWTAIFVALPSTVRRELAFVAHHATHHFAMVNLIAKGHLAMDLREGLGRAPATRRDDAAKHKR